MHTGSSWFQILDLLHGRPAIFPLHQEVFLPKSVFHVSNCYFLIDSYITKYCCINVRTHQCKTTKQYHGDYSCLKVLVLNELKGFESEVGPSLPERGIIVSSKEREAFVAFVRATVCRVVRHHHIFCACI